MSDRATKADAIEGKRLVEEWERLARILPARIEADFDGVVSDALTRLPGLLVNGQLVNGRSPKTPTERTSEG